jgi:hypothetical protein
MPKRSIVDTARELGHSLPEKVLQTEWISLDLRGRAAQQIAKQKQQNQSVRLKTDTLPLNYSPIFAYGPGR